MSGAGRPAAGGISGGVQIARNLETDHVRAHPGFAQWSYGADAAQSPGKDVLDNITLYWLTNTAASSARLYWENGARGSVIQFAAGAALTDIASRTRENLEE
jgi:hypothetical protein